MLHAPLTFQPRQCIDWALGTMDDPADMGSVRKAVDREQCVLLRQNLKGTLEQLKDARLPGD